MSIFDSKYKNLNSGRKHAFSAFFRSNIKIATAWGSPLTSEKAPGGHEMQAETFVAPAANLFESNRLIAMCHVGASLRETSVTRRSFRLGGSHTSWNSARLITPGVHSIFHKAEWPCRVQSTCIDP